MKRLKLFLRAAVIALIAVPLLYLLSIVPAVIALRNDVISIRQFFSFYRPLAPVSDTPFSPAVDWYAARVMPRVDTCGMGPSTFLQHVAFNAAQQEHATWTLIDIVTDATGTRYFLNSRQSTPEEIERALQKQYEVGTPDDRIFVRPDTRTTFTTVFDFLQRLRDARVGRLEVVGHDPVATRAAAEQSFLILTRDSFSRQQLPVSVPEKQPK